MKLPDNMHNTHLCVSLKKFTISGFLCACESDYPEKAWSKTKIGWFTVYKCCPVIVMCRFCSVFIIRKFVAISKIAFNTEFLICSVLGWFDVTDNIPFFLLLSFLLLCPFQSGLLLSEMPLEMVWKTLAHKANLRANVCRTSIDIFARL